MSGPDFEFICDQTNPILKKWIEETRPQAISRRDQEIEFLDARRKAVMSSWKNCWDDLFAQLQQSSVIDPKLLKEEWNMHVNDKNQLLISRQKNEADSLAVILKSLQ